jgi:signal transduction histidine kinase
MNEFGKRWPTKENLVHDAVRGQRTLQQAWMNGILCVVSGLFIFFLDYTFSTESSIPLLYVFVMLFAWRDPSYQRIMVTAVWCLVLIACGYIGTSFLREEASDLSVRLLAAIFVWGLALFLLAKHKMEQSFRMALQYKTAELEQSQSDLQASIRHREETEYDLADLNRTLWEQNQELETIVSVASHDLRSPLVNIQGFNKELDHSRLQLHALLQNHKLAPEYKREVMTILESDIPESLQYIQAGAKKMETLLQGLLRFSRLGRLTLKFEELNMNTMIAGIIMGMEYQLKEKGISLQIEDLPHCSGDVTLVNQLFFNLIDNAQKYVSPARPGMIRITGMREDGYARYGVEDNGIGIRDDHQERIFQMFHRLNPSSGKGEGLGLTIVRRIVERHKGHITLNSQLDRGTTFTIHLPVSQG